MPIALPADHIAVAFHHIGEGVSGEMVNTIAFDLTGIIDPVIQNFMDALSTLWKNGPHSKRQATSVYTHASAIYHDTLLGNVSLDSVQDAGTGGNGTAQELPYSMAIIVQKTTAFAGRKFRGRMFFGAVTVGAIDNVDSSKVNSSFLGALQTTFDTFQAGVEALGAIPVLLHQEGGPTPSRITKFDVHEKWGVIRKRMK